MEQAIRLEILSRLERLQDLLRYSEPLRSPEYALPIIRAAGADLGRLEDTCLALLGSGTQKPEVRSQKPEGTATAQRRPGSVPAALQRPG